MNQVITSTDQEVKKAEMSACLMHELRSPVAIAIGYVEEIMLVRRGLLNQLSQLQETGDIASKEVLDAVILEVDEQMGLCVEALKESVESLDFLLLEKRAQIGNSDSDG